MKSYEFLSGVLARQKVTSYTLHAWNRLVDHRYGRANFKILPYEGALDGANLREFRDKYDEVGIQLAFGDWRLLAADLDLDFLTPETLQKLIEDFTSLARVFAIPSTEQFEVGVFFSGNSFHLITNRFYRAVDLREVASALRLCGGVDQKWVTCMSTKEDQDGGVLRLLADRSDANRIAPHLVVFHTVQS